MNFFSKERIFYQFEKALLFLRFNGARLSYFLIPFLCWLFLKYCLDNNLIQLVSMKGIILILLLIVFEFSIIKIIRYYERKYYFDCQLKTLKYATEIKEEELIIFDKSDDLDDLLGYIDHYIWCIVQLRSLIEKYEDLVVAEYLYDCKLIFTNCLEVIKYFVSQIKEPKVQYLIKQELDNLMELKDLLISLNPENN